MAQRNKRGITTMDTNNKKIIQVADKLRVLYEKGELLTPISTRGLMQFDHNKKLFGEDLALQMFLNKFSREEARAIQSVLELVFHGKTKNPLVENAEQEAGTP